MRKLNKGDTVVFLFNADLDDYTFVTVGEKALVVADPTVDVYVYSGKSVRVRFNNSGKEFHVDVTTIMHEKDFEELTRGILKRYTFNGF